MVAFGQFVRMGLGATNRILVAKSRQNVFALGCGVAKILQAVGMFPEFLCLRTG